MGKLHAARALFLYQFFAAGMMRHRQHEKSLKNGLLAGF